MAQIQSIQVTAPNASYAKVGDNVDITVTFNAAVDYTGLRGLKLNTTPTKYAVPTIPTDNNKTQITFRYTVETGVHAYGEPVRVLAFEVEAGHIYDTGTSTPSDLTVTATTGIDVEIDGVAPAFRYGYHWPEWVKTGDTLYIRVFSDEVVMLPTATVSGRAAVLDSSDGQEHVFTYVIDNADAEDTDISLVVEGPDMADNIGTTTVAVPVKVDKLAPLAPPTPVPDEAVSGSGFANFSWDPAEDATYGEDGIHHYVTELYMDSQLTVTYTTSGPNDRNAYMISTFGDGSSAFEITCRVKAVDNVGRVGPWSTTSDPCTIDTRKLVCTVEPRLGDYAVNVPFDVDIHFRDINDNNVAVSLPSLSLIKVTNGAKGKVIAVDGTNSFYRLTITPTKTGTVTIQVLAGASKAAQGTPNYQSNVLKVQYDVTRPTCAITGPTGLTNQTLSYKITFSKPIVDFTDANLTLTGHQSVIVTGRGASYTAIVTPVAPLPATVTIKVADGEVLDDFGNSNRVSNMLTTTYDNEAPTVVNVSAVDSAGTVYGTGDVIKVQVGFDKNVYATTATPAKLKLYLAAALRNAAYLYGSGSQNLVFGYTVAANDPVVNSVTNGDLVIAATNYIKDRAGNLADDTCAESLGSSNLEVNPAFNPVTPTVPGIHSNISYTQTETAVTSKLDEGVIRSGVGDGDDLLVKIAAASTDSWMPRIRKGYAYYQDKELYLFAEKRTITTNNYGSGASVSLNFNKKGYDYKNPFQYGPVIVKGNSIPYTFVTSTMRAYGELTTKVAIEGTNNYKFTSPGLPVELYRTNLNEPMRRVPSVEAVQDMNEYYLDTVVEDVGGTPTLKYYVIAAGSAKVWCSYMLDTTDRFSQLEICVVDTQMRIRTMLKDVVQSGTYHPLIRVLEDGVFTELDGTSYIDGNVITLPQSYTRSDAATGTIKPGDRIGVKYWVNHSWALDNGNVIAFHLDSPNPQLTVEYEASLENEYKTDSLLSYKQSPSYVQLNPLQDGVSSGFLYIVDSDTVPNQPSVFRLAAAPAAATVAADPNKSQPVRVLFRAEDADGDPVAGYSIKVVTRGEIDFTRGSGDIDIIPRVPQTFDGVNITPIYVIYASEPYGTAAHWVVNTDYTMTFTSGAWNIHWLTTKRPAQGKALTFHFSPGLGKFEPSLWYPSNKLTDWKGELVGLWRPGVAGTRAIMRGSKSDDSLRKETPIWQQSYSDLATATFSDSQIPQKVFLTISEDSREPGTKVARAYVTDVTGAYPIVGAKVYFGTKSGRFSVPWPNTVLTNSDGVAENNYHPASEDVVWAYIVYGASTEVVSNKIYLGGNY